MLSVILLIVVLILAYKAAPRKKGRTSICTARVRLACWARWRSSVWTISHRITTPH
ncbi:MAG TPA: hypothetical protein VGA72_10785 [Anaerolineales bacterium]